MSQERKHSLFAPSATKRIIACPASVQATKDLPDRAGFFAIQGTVAHHLAERTFQDGGDPAALSGIVQDVEGHTIEIDDEQAEAIGVYVEFLGELKDAARKQGGWLVLEDTVRLDRLWSDEGQTPPGEVYGHLDAAAWLPQDATLVVGDYKHGAGVPVSVKENAQLLVYALGALFSMGKVANEVRKVRLAIIQPRAGHPGGPVQIEEWSKLDLMMWANDVYKPAIEEAAGPSPKYGAGDHCKFCGAAGVCPELRNRSLAAAKQDFDEIDLASPLDPLDTPPPPPEPTQLSPYALAEIMQRAAMIETWIDAVRVEAAHRLENGQDVPGWKLVAKRAQRKWNDERVAEELLLAALGTEAHTRKLISPAQAEKKLKKEHFRQTYAPLVSQVSSGTTLAPAHDLRPEIKKGGAEFDALP